MVVGLLAILKSGAAYLPIDLEYPRERLEFTIDDAQPVAVLTHSAHAANLPATELPRVLVDDETLSQEDRRRYRHGSRPGRRGLRDLHLGLDRPPKGRAWSRTRNVVRLFDATERWFGFGPSDVWTFFHSLRLRLLGVGDLGRAALRRPRGRGAATLTTPLAGRLPRPAGAREGDGAQPDAVGLPPADRRRRRAAAPAERAAPALRHLRRRGAGAARCCAPGSSATATRQPQLVNMYGITETTVHVTYRPVGAARPRSAPRQHDRRARFPTCASTCSTTQLPPVAGRRTGRDRGRRRRRGAATCAAPS